MITGDIKNQIDRIWDAFWTGGISNPLEVIEQITYLLFIRRLDDLHTLEENRSTRLKQPMQRRIFPEGNDGIGRDDGRAYEDLRWSLFRQFAAAEMYDVVSEHVFPFLRTLNGTDSAYGSHMKDARFTIPTPALLTKVVDMLDKVPMEDRDTKGDLYEYMLGKIATAGQNGQFRTLRRAVNEADGRGLFVRSLVGLERGAAKDTLASFVADTTLTANQIEFVNLIVNHLTEHGVIEPARLYESPFTDLTPRGPDSLFSSAQVEQLIDALEGVRKTAMAA